MAITLPGELSRALRGNAAQSYSEAWNENRADNLNKMVELMDPIADAMDILAEAVLGNMYFDFSLAR